MKLTKEKRKQLEELKEDVKDNWNMKRGKNEYLKHLEHILGSGPAPTRLEAMLAQCYACCYGYDGGVFDCQATTCSIYHYMPYRDARARKEYSEEERETMMARVAKMQSGKRMKAQQKGL